MPKCKKNIKISQDMSKNFFAAIGLGGMGLSHFVGPSDECDDATRLV